MKSLFLALLLTFSVTPVLAQTASIETENEELDTDESVLKPEEEELYIEYFNRQEDGTRKDGSAFEIFLDDGFRFKQTIWGECSDEITGNYYGYNCAKRRGISEILYTFLNNYIYQCIDKGLAAQGGGKVSELHIVHAGILGDRRHSPKSLHAENRAIDIREFEMKLTSGAVKKFVFEKSADRKFFTAFRSCWGEVVKKNNGCPYYKGTPGLTATIGWEDKNHQHHMHTSVPYCVGGKYGAYYYQK